MAKPKIRFKGYQDDWEQRKLSEIAIRVTEKNKNNEFTEPFTNSAELGIISQKEYFEREIVNDENLDGYYIVRKDDFVYNPRISGTAPVGPINRNRLERNGVMSPLYTVFRVHDIADLYLEYYFKTTNWHRFMKLNGDSGARFDRFTISSTQFMEMPIPYPEVEEQKKIGAYFEHIDHLITLHQRKCDEAKKLKKFMLQKMFPQNGSRVPEIRFDGFTDDWEQRKLGDVSESYSGGTPSVENKSYYGGSIPFIRSAEINSESTELFLTEEGLTNSSARMVYKGDILYALYGATSGETGRSRINGAINQAILAILPHDGYDSEFLMQWLRKSKQNITDVYLQGGQGNLSGAIVKALDVNFPSLAEQWQIGNYFQSIDHLITLHQQKCDDLKNLKKYMLQNMFV